MSSMAKGCVFVFLVCFALASYAADQGSDSDQCLVYRKGYPAYYTCIIKCFQFVLGFEDSTASFCTNKFRMTKASLHEYNNTHAVNTLKCIAIKCRQFVPEDVCEGSSPGIGSSTDFSDFTTAFSTTSFVDDANSGLSTSAPSSSGTTVGESTSPGLLSTSGSSVNTPPSFTNAGTTSSSLAPDNSMPSTTPSPSSDDASQNSGDEQPSDSDECDEEGDDMFDDASSGGASTLASTTDLNPYYSDEGYYNSPSPDDGFSGYYNSPSPDDGFSGYYNSPSPDDGFSASATSTNSGGDSSSASAASDSGEDGASASASSADNDGDDSSASANSDLDFFYYFIYDDDDEQSNSTFNSNSNNASATNLSSTSVQPSQSTPQPSIGTTSSDSADDYYSESPDDTSNDGMPPGDETSDNQFDAGNNYYDYAAADTVAGQDGSGSYSFSDSRGGNNNPQVPQNPSWAPFGSNPQQPPVYYPPQAPAYNPQQAPAFNPQQAPAFNPQQAQVFNPQQAEAFNLQQAQVYNPQQVPVNYPQQAPIYNSQQELTYNPQQMPNWNNNNNNWNYAQQNRRQQIPIQNKWNRRQQGLLPANNQGYQWNQGNLNNNGWQRNPANIPSANNGRFLRNRGIPANNEDY
ncbi:DNA-directed RNA polymerase II subunit RPB1-like [Argiope bruennichi]|uniref:DNA-directed RNA polymerase II subunit RPB1-like n=1 Tax=Argiope bruennichi TaxID=94029 RepID=UPI0024952424|nr:DNA-directed RNA polymerase II subunit RPB1-like [Argiope bruennichi]